MMICHRARGSSFVILGVEIVFSPLHIYYVGDYSCASDYKFYIYSPISICGVMNTCVKLLGVLYLVWRYITSFHYWILRRLYVCFEVTVRWLQIHCQEKD
jgi:hypothetical protein